jgi:hypothetical protein
MGSFTFKALRGYPVDLNHFAVRRMSVICALRTPAHASQDALTGLPASSFMSVSTLQYVTSALADAMLAGAPEPEALVRRMTFVVGASALSKKTHKFSTYGSVFSGF